MKNLLTEHDDEKKRQLVSKIARRLNSSRTHYQEKFALWKKCYKLYRAHSDEEHDRNEPDIKIAFIFGIVERVVSKLTAPFAGKLPIRIAAKRHDHKRKAENYYAMAKAWHTSPDRLIDFTNATRERVITGSCWEVDEWDNVYQDGWRWAKDRLDKIVDVNLPTFGRAVKPVIEAAGKLSRKVSVDGYVKKKWKFPVKVGYSLRYPSIYNMYPQPRVLDADKLQWVIEEQESVPLDELKSYMFRDEDGELKPVYDLSYFDKLKKDEPERMISPQQVSESGEMENFRKEISDAGNASYDEDGIDSVYVMVMRTPEEVLVTANDQLIYHVKQPYHKPGLKVRLRVYTPDNHSLYGVGVVEPVIPMLEELDDVHNLSMQNWVRIINRMLIYDEDAIPYPDDFLPRAGGRIRGKGPNLQHAIVPIDHKDVTSEMLTAESNLRGLIETVLAVTDFSPGTQGTKPYHKTYGGLIELQQAFAQRFLTIVLTDQAQTIKQLDSMYWFYEQYMFEPVTLEGTQGAIEYKREDIDSDGAGFLYRVSEDPSFGDSAVQRNQNMVLLGQALQYEQVRASNPEWKNRWKALDAGKVMADVLASFKHGEADEYLKDPEEAETPENEFQFMLQGLPAEVNPRERLIEHWITHNKQMRMIENGAEQYPPELASALSEHLAKTQEVIQLIVSNPGVMVEEDTRADIRAEAAPGAGEIKLPDFGREMPGNEMAAGVEEAAE